MQLISLKGKGFGPYTDEFSIQFPSSRKVAILGQNGAGKTFLLDAIPAVLFKTVPNRKGGFYDNFSSSDAYIDFEFSLNGAHYRAKRLVNATSRTQKAFIWKDGECLSDGKEGAFNLALDQSGINQTAFLAAIYQSQNGTGSALTMDVESRIKLLSIILDLMRFDGDHAKAVEAHKQVSQEVSNLRVRREELVNQIPAIDAAYDREQHEIVLKETCSKMEQVESEIEKAIQSVADAKANAQGVDDLKREAANLENHIVEDNKMVEEYNLRILNNQKLLSEKAEIDEALKTIEIEQKNIENHQKSIENEQKTIENARNLMDSWNEAQKQVFSDSSKKLAAIRGECNEHQQEYKKIQSEVDGLKREVQFSESQIESLKPSTEIIGRVPCKGMDINSQCELLKNAHSNIEKVEELKKKITASEEALFSLQETLEFNRKKALEYRQNEVLAEAEFNQLNGQLPPTEYKEAIQTSSAIKADLQLDIDKSKQLIAIAQEKAKYASKLEGIEERIADYEKQKAPLETKISINQEALEVKRQRIQDASDIEQTIAIAEINKGSLLIEKKQLESDKQTALNELARIDAEQRKAESLLSDISGMDELITDRSGLLAEIGLLREGLGPKGAKNVKIDAAGKAITERANRLIRIGLGPQFSLSINTLRELQSKDEDGNPEVRETLELRIINNETGEEMLIENLSGGEKAMAGLVFSLSLAVEQREACGLDVRCLILDEPSAGLSEENSIKYLDMLDAVLDETGIEQVLFISHMPSMQALADASISVSKGQDGQSSTVKVN